jgi:hypothetical protein
LQESGPEDDGANRLLSPVGNQKELAYANPPGTYAEGQTDGRRRTQGVASSLAEAKARTAVLFQVSGRKAENAREVFRRLVVDDN